MLTALIFDIANETLKNPNLLQESKGVCRKISFEYVKEEFKIFNFTNIFIVMVDSWICLNKK